MVIAKIRKRGASYVVTVPREEVDRLGLKDGDSISLEMNRVEVRPVLPDDVRASFEKTFPRWKAAYEYLRDN